MDQNTNDQPHAGAPGTAKQYFWTSVGTFLIPLAIIVGVVFWITADNDRTGQAENSPAKVEARIKPVATLVVAGAGGAAEKTAATAPAGGDALAAGKKLYESTCIACHGTGAAGAPKFGDKADWAPRIKLGLDKLVDVAIHGLGAMPPRGGSQATDAELKEAVIYMTDHSGADFAAPGAAPAEAKPAAAAPAAAAPAAAAAKPAAEAKPAAAKAEAAAPAAGGEKVDLAAGKKLYESTCIACHGSGVLGAPKFGNKADWAPRIAQGTDALVKAAIHGIGAMPPRGGSQATDAEMRDAVTYMVDAAK